MNASLSTWVIGIDLGDRMSHFSRLDAHTGESLEGRFSMTRKALAKCFADFPRCRVALEVGGHSRWVSAELTRLGFEVTVANPARLKLISQSKSKNDRNDALMLAQLLAAPFNLLHRVSHRSDKAQADLSVIRARDHLVRIRTALVNHIRGVIKATGFRLPSCSASSVHKHFESVPEDLRPALKPIFDSIQYLGKQIKGFDKKIAKLCEETYPETQALLNVRGVGPITALAFVLTLEDPKRFIKSRSVGAYLGLRPGQCESGTIKKQLGITKTGDHLLRRLLVNGAQYMLGPFGEDCDLRRWGLDLAQRGGKCAKKRAVVAVARKLAVLLHRLWADQTEYEPLRSQKKVA